MAEKCTVLSMGDNPLASTGYGMRVGKSFK